MDPSLPIRPVVRETMALAPNRKWTVKALHAQLAAEYPDITEATVTAALRWNQSRGFTDYVFNSEFDRDEWHLTVRGKAED